MEPTSPCTRPPVVRIHETREAWKLYGFKPKVLRPNGLLVAMTPWQWLTRETGIRSKRISDFVDSLSGAVPNDEEIERLSIATGIPVAKWRERGSAYLMKRPRLKLANERLGKKKV